MCRFLVYQGDPILLSKLLTEPKHSLIKQSYNATERSEPLNGDGFGVGWYDKSLHEEACIFTSVRPAWANRNLTRMVAKIQSSLVFAHVRAATEGLPVTELNCHPFQRGKLLWMHNGSICDFAKIKRHLRRSLSENSYNWLEGSTDSEHAFALVYDHLDDSKENGPEEWLEAIRKAIAQIKGWVEEFAPDAEPLRCNFAITDGRQTLVTRYVGSDIENAESLYYSSGSAFTCDREGEGHLEPEDKEGKAVIVASEPTTEDRSDWTLVPNNHAVLIDQECKVELVKI